VHPLPIDPAERVAARSYRSAPIRQAASRQRRDSSVASPALTPRACGASW